MLPTLKSLPLAALAVGLAGPAALAAGTHVMLVALPDGGVARIAYAGDTAPSVMVAPSPSLAATRMEMPDMAGPGSAFAMLARLQAQMERQESVMLREAGFLASPGVAPAPFAVDAAGPGALIPAALASDPHACVEETSISEVAGERPRVAAFRSAGCGAATLGQPGREPVVTAPAAVRAAPPRLIEARLEPGLERQAVQP